MINYKVTHLFYYIKEIKVEETIRNNFRYRKEDFK